MSYRERIAQLGILLVVMAIAACANMDNQQSPVETREYQTRIYENVDQVTVFKAVINALQDDGFVVENADANVGLIVASMDSTQVQAGKVLQKAGLTVITYGLYWLWADPNVTYARSLHVTANITPLEQGIKTRLNFVGKQFNSKGVLVKSGQSRDKAYYQDVFRRIEKSVFLEENL